MKSIGWKHLVKHELTVALYKQQFPGCATMSLESAQKKSTGAKIANVARVGVPRSDEVKAKIKQSKSSNPKAAWNKGVVRTQDQNDQLSTTRLKKFSTGELTHWNVGKLTSGKTKSKISRTLLMQDRVYSDTSKKLRTETIAAKKGTGWIHHSTRKLTADQLQKLDDGDWIYKEHVVNKQPLSYLLSQLGLHHHNSIKTITSRMRKFNIPICRFPTSQGEKEISQFLLDIGIVHHTNIRTVITPLELDVYIPSHNVAIEYCGLYWHSNRHKDRNYHSTKLKMCNDRGIRLITIFEDEWIHTSHLVKQKLRSILGNDERSRIHARKCRIAIMSVMDKRDFFDKHHIQGDGTSSINLGLYHLDQLVACMGFSVHADGVYYLTRYATSSRVAGGFSKLLNHFTKTTKYCQIVSFADLRWSEGHMYQVCGFRLDRVIPPDYRYIIQDKTVHKFNFRHHMMQKKLANYDANLSETENADAHGLLRIYDCGKQRWVLMNHNQ
jgi:hypothetical protein